MSVLLAWVSVPGRTAMGHDLTFNTDAPDDAEKAMRSVFSGIEEVSDFKDSAVIVFRAYFRELDRSPARPPISDGGLGGGVRLPRSPLGTHAHRDVNHSRKCARPDVGE